MYDAEVAYQDAMLGKFFDRLRQSGQLDNTLVIICADHGEHLGEKQFMGHSLSIYNELIRVPLIIRDPSRASCQQALRWNGGLDPAPVPHRTGRSWIR
jgi:arylsulfatase A-like enzyme